MPPTPSQRATSAPVAVFSSNGCRLILEFWPVAVVTIGPDAEREDYVGLLAAIDRHVIARREPYLIVTETRGIGRPPGADVRKLIVDWMEKNAKGHTSLGSVTIIGSALIRGALTALYWLFTPPSPQGVASGWPEARDWCVQKLNAANIRPPERLLLADTERY